MIVCDVSVRVRARRDALLVQVSVAVDDAPAMPCRALVVEAPRLVIDGDVYGALARSCSAVLWALVDLRADAADARVGEWAIEAASKARRRRATPQPPRC
jgi:hypothetical protein